MTTRKHNRKTLSVFTLSLFLLTLALLSFATTAQATLLTYEGVPDGSPFEPTSQNYGDNVTHPDTNAFGATGSAGGDTPFITVDHGAGSVCCPGTGFAYDLTDLGYIHGEMEITFTATQGQVNLDGFLFGSARDGKEATVSVSVNGGAFDVIRSGPLGAGVSELYSNLTFTGTTVVLRYELTAGAGGADMAFDDIQFSSGIPEPSSLVLAALGLFGLLGYRRRRRRK
ncbi:MAG: PEP-CTERM sorting domain-containing protein [Planctomycetes bacterium]|nr:PEP-CTERM sorting domain-containing protein [Planctomycetota bacterium]